MCRVINEGKRKSEETKSIWNSTDKESFNVLVEGVKTYLKNKKN